MLIDCHNHLGVDLFFYLNGYFPYAQDLPTLVIEGRHNGIDRWVVFPMVSNLWFDVGAMRAGRFERGAGIESVPYAFENERMLREIYELHSDLAHLTIPFAIIDPMREPTAQVKVLRELHRKFPFYGLKIQATIIQADAGALLTTGRCLLELAAELDVPMLIHSSVAPDDPWSNGDLLLRIAEATPNVRFCLAHSLRFDREYLDRVAALPNVWFDCSAHRIHCESVLRGYPNVAVPARRFAADYTNPTAVLRALAEAYPRKLIWGSDSPFQSYVAVHHGALMSLRSTYEEEVACLRAMSGATQNAIAQDNLLSLLCLKDESVLTRG